MWEGGSREDWVLALPWSGVSCEFLKKKTRRHDGLWKGGKGVVQVIWHD